MPFSAALPSSQWHKFTVQQSRIIGKQPLEFLFSPP